MEDYQVIIVWKPIPELINEIKKSFQLIVFEKTINLSSHERFEKINQLYTPIKILPNDNRCINTQPITLFLVRTPTQHEFVFRTEGFRLCNLSILQFKQKLRLKFDYTHFHTSDNVIETKHALDVFKITDVKIPGNIVHVKDLYCFHHEGISHDDTYHNKKYTVTPLKDSKAVKYLMGFKDEYLFGNNIFLPRPLTFDYLTNSTANFNQTHPLSIIPVKKYKDKYMILDGMHRASVLYYFGNRYIYVTEETLPNADETYTNYLVDEKISLPQPNSHLENLNEILFRLNNNNIRYVMIRGWHTMPFAPNTDLDTIVHPNDFDKFIKIMQSCLIDKITTQRINKNYGENLQYTSYSTTGTLEKFLPNSAYQLDIYNNAFFFESDSKGLNIGDSFTNYLFATKRRWKQLYVPDEFSELILLLYRTYIDKNGAWLIKHQQRFDDLLLKIDKIKFFEFSKQYTNKLITIDVLKTNIFK